MFRIVKEFKEGEKYWVLTDTTHSLCVDEYHYDDLKHLELSHTTHRMDEGKMWYFKNPEEEYGFTILDEWNIEQFVYPTPDDFLYYLVVHLDNINDMRNEPDQPKYYFSDEMKKKIEESQEGNPQIWV